MRTEVVTRVRGGVQAPLRTLCPVQPRAPRTSEPGVFLSAYRLDLAEDADLVENDRVIVRGVVHRVAEAPERRAGFALVVIVEEDSADLASFDCVVTIGPAGVSPVFDPVTRRTRTVAAPPAYTGPAAVRPVSTSEGTAVETADDLSDARRYTVGLPAGAGDEVEINHVVTVTDAPNTALVGRRLHVTSIARPGEEVYRELVAQLYDD